MTRVLDAQKKKKKKKKKRQKIAFWNKAYSSTSRVYTLLSRYPNILAS